MKAILFERQSSIDESFNIGILKRYSDEIVFFDDLLREGETGACSLNRYLHSCASERVLFVNRLDSVDVESLEWLISVADISEHHVFVYPQYDKTYSYRISDKIKQHAKRE